MKGKVYFAMTHSPVLPIIGVRAGHKGSNDLATKGM